MYRARVESVSGVRVRAGGKWLTCIGNKNVHVGDLVWTDGRCVYGHEQTPQQPIVIPTQQEELGIPIITTGIENHDATNRQPKYYTYLTSHKLKDETDNMDIQKNKEKFRNRSGRYFLSNNADGKIVVAYNSYAIMEYKWGTIAINVDDSGNIYQMIKEKGTTKENPGFLPTLYYKIVIKKNDNVVYSTAEDAFVSLNSSTCSAFIEDENNWYFITGDLIHLEGESSHDGSYMSYHAKYTLHNQQGEKTLIDNHLESTLDGVNRNVTAHFDNLVFPMHDGFFFKISDFEFWENGQRDMPFKLKYNLYSDSSDKPFFKYDATSLSCNFSACKFKKNMFLCHAAYLGNNQDKLYLVGNEESTELEKTNIFNQCLRPMKRYKGWWEKIQTLDTD